MRICNVSATHCKWNQNPVIYYLAEHTLVLWTDALYRSMAERSMVVIVIEQEIRHTYFKISKFDFRNWQ